MSHNLDSATSDISEGRTFTLPKLSTIGFSSYDVANIAPELSSRNGVYYNWFAATAGTGMYNLTSGNATDSVCPYNWILPYGTQQNKSWHFLIDTTYKYISLSQILRSPPLDMTFSGWYVNSALRNETRDGYLWTSTAASNTSAISMDYWEQFIKTQNVNNDSKRDGFLVRCVAR